MLFAVAIGEEQELTDFGGGADDLARNRERGGAVPHAQKDERRSCAQGTIECAATNAPAPPL